MKKDEFIRSKPNQSAFFGKSRFGLFALYIVPFLLILITMYISTWDFARRVGDVSILGNPLFYIDDNPVYSPWMILGWFFKFHILSENYGFVKVHLTESIKWLMGGTIATFVYIFFLVIMGGKKVRKRNLHGTARWGNDKDLKYAGLCAKNGLIYGQKNYANIKAISTDNDLVLKTKSNADLIMYNGYSSSLIFMPPRSGKGVSVLMPSLYANDGSVIVNDIKGELYNITSGYRSSFSHILKFSLSDSFSLSINPLMFIKEETAYSDAHTYSSILLAPVIEGHESGTENHFRESAIDGLTGFILHVLCSDYPDKSFGGVLDFVSSPGLVEEHQDENVYSALDNLLKDMQTSEHTNSEIHKHIQLISARLLQKEIRERSGVLSSVLKALLVFQDPIVRKNTSSNQIDFNMFIESEMPISLYLTTSYKDLKRTSPVLNLIISASIACFTTGTTQHDDIRLKNKLTYELDEMHALGAIPNIDKSVAALPGYGINFRFYVQSLKQITKTYGKDHPFFDLCKIICFSQIGDLETAKMLSEMIGKETVLNESVNNQLKVDKLGVSGSSQSISEIGRLLINPDEIMKLSFTDLIVMKQGMPPYRAKKVVYYDDPRFKEFQHIKPISNYETLVKEIPNIRSDSGWFYLPSWTYWDSEEEQLLLDSEDKEVLIDDKSNNKENVNRILENMGVK